MVNNKLINEENKLLEEKLEELKGLNYSEGPENKEKVKKIVDEVNKILCMAIYDYPDLVNSVNIGLSNKLKNNKTILSEPYHKEGIYNHLLFFYEQLSHSNKKSLSKEGFEIEILKNLNPKFINGMISKFLTYSENLKITKHLPYIFTGVPEGSYQIEGIVCSNICLTVMVDSFEEQKFSKEKLGNKESKKANNLEDHPDQIMGRIISLGIGERINKIYLANDITSYMIMKNPRVPVLDKVGYLPIEYVEYLELSKEPNNKFTPLLEIKPQGDLKLKKTISPVSHYLKFRHFEKTHLSNLYIPHVPYDITEGLNKYDPKENTFSGFAVVSLSQDPVLYEFNNFLNSFSFL